MNFLGDPLLSESVTKLNDTIVSVTETTASYKPELIQLQQTLQRIAPLINDVVKLNRILDRPKQFIEEIKDAEKLVKNCSKTKRNFIKKFTDSLKLEDLNNKLLRYFQLEVQADGLTLESDEEMFTRLSMLIYSKTQRLGYELAERQKFGWWVPILPEGIVGFDGPLQKLKAKFLQDESSVVVVVAGGGCGKTTLVTMLKDDKEIQAKYRENVFNVPVAETPNFMVIVNNLLKSYLSENFTVQSDEDAKDKLEKFLREQVSGPFLLILDDVPSDLFIRNFEFKIGGYKILVTSKMIFQNRDVFHLRPLSEEDVKTIFMRSAFGDHERMLIFDDDLVNQMVKHCKKHPLTLYTVGNSLNGKSEFVWKSVIKTLSQGEWVLDNKDVTQRLKSIIGQLDVEYNKRFLDFEALDENFKECLLDLVLFPRDCRIPASALLDMWTNLYGHDDMGRDTLIKIFQLAGKNLVSSITIGEEANAIVNYCEQTYVTQKDLQRELAIHLSSLEPIAWRTRVIINAQGNDLPAPIRQVKNFLYTRILSISTGESISSWHNMKFPEVEVMLLNIMSQTYSTYTLPNFLANMKKLKVLNISNYGSYPTQFVNGYLLGNLTSLTRIRLERVVLPQMSSFIVNLVSLQKLSFIKCKIDKGFEKLSTDNPNFLPKLVEIEIDECTDLVEFEQLFCNSVHLKKLSITNCNELFSITEEVGKLTSLETLSLRCCTRLKKLPCSISRLEKLSILDISDCLSLIELPKNIGKLGGLRKIYMKGCTGIHELPPSVKDLSQLQVLCSEEISYKWCEYPNVKLPTVEEDRLLSLTKSISYSCF